MPRILGGNMGLGLFPCIEHYKPVAMLALKLWCLSLPRFIAFKDLQTKVSQMGK